MSKKNASQLEKSNKVSFDIIKCSLKHIKVICPIRQAPLDMSKKNASQLEKSNKVSFDIIKCSLKHIKVLLSIIKGQTVNELTL